MKKTFFTVLFLAIVSFCSAQTINVHLKNGEVVKYESDKVDYVDFSEKEESSSDPTEPTDDPTNPTDDPANYDITQHISAYFSGGSISQRNDLIVSGSQLNWTFMNSSKYNVVLTGIVLIDGIKGTETSNLLKENAEVSAGKSVTYSITVGLAGVSKPKVRFSYIYDGKVYATEAVYKSFSF